jgi:hypothetical protein
MCMLLYLYIYIYIYLCIFLIPVSIKGNQESEIGMDKPCYQTLPVFMVPLSQIGLGFESTKLRR